MSKAYRCDITGDCIAEDESPNPYFVVLENDNVTVLDKEGVKVSISVTVDVFQNGMQCHIGDNARAAIRQMIKAYVQNNF